MQKTAKLLSKAWYSQKDSNVFNIPGIMVFILFFSFVSKQMRSSDLEEDIFFQSLSSVCFKSQELQIYFYQWHHNTYLNLPQVNSLFWQQCESLIQIYQCLMYLHSSQHCVQLFGNGMNHMYYILNTTDCNHTFILKKIWLIDGQAAFYQVNKHFHQQTFCNACHCVVSFETADQQLCL